MTTVIIFLLSFLSFYLYLSGCMAEDALLKYLWQNSFKKTYFFKQEADGPHLLPEQQIGMIKSA